MLRRATFAPVRYAVRAATPAIALGRAALTALLAACSDSSTGPTQPSAPAASRAVAPPPPAAMLAALAQNVQGATTGPSFSRVADQSALVHGDTAIYTVTFDPTVAHTIAFTTRTKQNGVALAANSVCDPATSGYGPLLWDAPCHVATRPFTLTVRGWVGADGQPKVAFSPDIRFSPSATNWLWLAGPGANSAKAKGLIAWCPTTGGVCVNESALDGSVTTGTNQGVYYRRIKHFSGYTVVVNRADLAY